MAQSDGAEWARRFEAEYARVVGLRNNRGYHQPRAELQGRDDLSALGARAVLAGAELGDVLQDLQEAPRRARSI